MKQFFNRWKQKFIVIFSVSKVQVDQLAIYQLSNVNALNLYHRLVFSESGYCKLMNNKSARELYKWMVETHKIVTIGPWRLIGVDCIIVIIA